MRNVPTSVAVILAITALLTSAFAVAAVLLHRAEKRRQRIQLPARLVSRQWVGPGDMLTIEFPGPDGSPRRTTLFSATRTGLGATPTFQGWVWVNRADPSDVVVRPNARAFWPVMLGSFAGFVLLGGTIAALVIGIGSAYS